MKYIEEIYENIVVESEYMKSVDKAMEKDIDKVMKYLVKDNKISKNFEEIRDMLYGVADSTKRKAFEVGFHYGISVIMEVLSDSKH